MIISYCYKIEKTEDIEILDIENFALLCIGSTMKEYILMSTTKSGITSLIQYGPISFIQDDFCFSEYKLTCLYQRFEYNEKKLYKIISQYINDPVKMINTVSLIDFEEAKNKIVSPVNFL